MSARGDERALMRHPSSRSPCCRRLKKPSVISAGPGKETSVSGHCGGRELTSILTSIALDDPRLLLDER